MSFWTGAGSALAALTGAGLGAVVGSALPLNAKRHLPAPIFDCTLIGAGLGAFIWGAVTPNEQKIAQVGTGGAPIDPSRFP